MNPTTPEKNSVKFYNIRDTVLQNIIKQAIRVDLTQYPKITYVYWHRSENEDNKLGLTAKVFPSKEYGAQHLYKFTFIDNGVEFEPISKESCDSIKDNMYQALKNHYLNERK